eukprot:04414.XXX_105669_106347_1 [CDS] Oithona nana genome sequencing.
MSYTTCLFFFFVLATSPVESRRRQDPCKGYKHSDFQYKLPDPYNCKKFWMCSGGPRGNHFTCPPGTSFDPDSKVGSCTGPPPVLVKACYKNKGKWQSWTTWSECSSTCGQGFKIRSRACLGERHHCQGKATQYETCPDNPENIDINEMFLLSKLFVKMIRYIEFQFNFPKSTLYSLILLCQPSQAQDLAFLPPKSQFKSCLCLQSKRW